MMKNNQNDDFLEDYFFSKKDEFFEEEPPFGHFNRFSEKLEELHEEQSIVHSGKSHTRRNWFAYSAAASIILILVFAGFSFLNWSEEEPEFTPEQNVHIQQNNFQFSSTENGNNVRSLEKVNELEMEYLNLKFQYSQTNDSSILEKIKENLSQRAFYIEQLRHHHSANHIHVTNANELHEGGDCCGFDSGFAEHQDRDLYGEVMPTY